jgi:hypothetical protein
MSVCLLYQQADKDVQEQEEKYEKEEENIDVLIDAIEGLLLQPVELE